MRRVAIQSIQVKAICWRKWNLVMSRFMDGADNSKNKNTNKASIPHSPTVSQYAASYLPSLPADTPVTSALRVQILPLPLSSNQRLFSNTKKYINRKQNWFFKLWIKTLFWGRHGRHKRLLPRQQPPALKLPQSSPPLPDQELHRHPRLLHLHFVASETAVLSSSNWPSCLGLQFHSTNVKTN